METETKLTNYLKAPPATLCIQLKVHSSVILDFNYQKHLSKSTAHYHFSI